MFSLGPTGFKLCFSYVNAIFQSIFHKFLFIDLCRICQRTKVCNIVFIICSLLVGIDCDWLFNSWMKATFSWMKYTLFRSQFSPQNTENRIIGLWNFRTFWGNTSPNRPRKKGTNGHLLIARVGYSIQTCWPLQFLLKPLPSNWWYINPIFQIWSMPLGYEELALALSQSEMAKNFEWIIMCFYLFMGCLGKKLY